MKLEELIDELTDQRIIQVMEEFDNLHPAYLGGKKEFGQIPAFRMMYELSLKNIAEDLLDKYSIIPKQQSNG